MEQQAFDDVLELYRWRFGVEDPSVLDWTGSMRVRTRITDAPARDERPNAPARNTVIFGPAGESLAHPDRSLDVVVLDDLATPAKLAEAERVARDAIVSWARGGDVTARWLRDRPPRAPDVSIVVHTRGAPGPLDACLRSLFETTPVTGAIEIVVADAGETEAAAGVVAAWSQRLGLRHVRADPAGGTVAACNLAAGEAAGELLVFLGERVQALTGWLRPLVRTLRDDPGIGVVAGKVVGEDGTLEAAGGLLFADGSVASFGHGAPDAEAPVAGFVRDVHYVAADLLATRAGLYRRLGGMDRVFADGWEDVDLCLRMRAAGRRVVYQPQSVVTGSARPAGDRESDARKRFVRRWATALADLPARPEHFGDATWDRLARVG